MLELKKIAKGTCKVILALLTGMLMPILIWVALGMIINQKMQTKKLKQTVVDKLVEPKKFIPQPIEEIHQHLAITGLYTLENTFTKHCWEALNCPPERYNNCPASNRREIPYWALSGPGKAGLDSNKSIAYGTNQKEGKGLPAFRGLVS